LKYVVTTELKNTQVCVIFIVVRIVGYEDVATFPNDTPGQKERDVIKSVLLDSHGKLVAFG
jgi:uncharacterized protein YvpB